MKKRLLWGLPLLALIVLIAWVYTDMNGNPLTAYLSKSKLEKHLAKSYPDQNLRINRSYYNFKFKEYVFEVQNLDDLTADRNDPSSHYEIALRGWFAPSIVRDGIYNAGLDRKLMETLSIQAEQELHTLLTSRGIPYLSVFVHLEVSKGQLASDTVWDKGLALNKPLEIHLDLDASGQSKEDTLQAAQTIQALLDEAEIPYHRVVINSMLESPDVKSTGIVKYYVPFKKNTSIKLSHIHEY